MILLNQTDFFDRCLIKNWLVWSPSLCRSVLWQPAEKKLVHYKEPNTKLMATVSWKLWKEHFFELMIYQYWWHASLTLQRQQQTSWVYKINNRQSNMKYLYAFPLYFSFPQLSLAFTFPAVVVCCAFGLFFGLFAFFFSSFFCLPR